MNALQWQVGTLVFVVCGLFVAVVQLITIYRNRKG